MQLIDAYALEKQGWTMNRTVAVDPQTMEMQVKKPTDFPAIIDAIPVVRCKDCKYMTEHYDTDGNVPYWTCSQWDSGTD